MNHTHAMLYRIAEPADWQQAQQTGFFASPDLKAEGFIHTSELYQVVETANRYYAGRADMLLLELDEKAVQAAGISVKREFVASRQQEFAHVFGPIPLTAIGRIFPLVPQANGGFTLPAELV
ncbi:DUF952 domain-containing protein [Hymenobacter koreensis]|uniref:DUF952 domain-containing protein n=1 Tax=Hymenobacter koreensis TaxID=1084523 RepID=A0ABP8J3S5_9BACT